MFTAEKYVTGITACAVSMGGKRFMVPSLTFSGIEKNDGMEYLCHCDVSMIENLQIKLTTNQSCVFTRVPFRFHSKPSFLLSGHHFGWIPIPSNPSGQADPSPPKRLNNTTFPLTSPSVGI